MNEDKWKLFSDEELDTLDHSIGWAISEGVDTKLHLTLQSEIKNEAERRGIKIGIEKLLKLFQP